MSYFDVLTTNLDNKYDYPSTATGKLRLKGSGLPQATWWDCGLCEIKPGMP